MSEERAIVRLTLEKPKRLRDVEAWLELAHDAGMSDQSTVSVSLGNIDVGAYVDQIARGVVKGSG